MLRYLTQAILVLFAAAGITYAANVPTVSTTPAMNEPSQEVASLNTLVASINANTPGAIAAMPAPFTTTGTGANTVIQATVSQINTAGNVIHIHGWGVNSADANAKTVTVNFGASGTMAVAVTASGAKWWFDAYIQNVGTVGSPAWQGEIHGAQAATLITDATTSGSDAQGALTLNVTMTAATAGTMTMNGLYAEVMK